MFSCSGDDEPTSLTRDSIVGTWIIEGLGSDVVTSWGDNNRSVVKYWIERNATTITFVEDGTWSSEGGPFTTTTVYESRPSTFVVQSGGISSSRVNNNTWSYDGSNFKINGLKVPRSSNNCYETFEKIEFIPNSKLEISCSIEETYTTHVNSPEYYVTRDAHMVLVK